MGLLGQTHEMQPKSTTKYFSTTILSSNSLKLIAPEYGSNNFLHNNTANSTKNGTRCYHNRRQTQV
jgi:hypothetical protein